MEEIDLNVSDENLLAMSSDRVLALSLPEMKAIQAYLKNPAVVGARRKVGLGERITDVELEALAQTWSEHCKHKIFNAVIEYESGRGRQTVIDSLFKTYIKGSTKVDPGSQGEEGLLSFRLQGQRGRHQVQREIQPRLQGRDAQHPFRPGPLWRGAHRHRRGEPRSLRVGKGRQADLQHGRLLFCHALLGRNLRRGILHPRRVFEGVREGVEHGGNKSGIPTVNGSSCSMSGSSGKPLVYCGTAASCPRDNGRTQSRQEDQTRGPHRHVRRPDRQGRHPRRHLLVGGASRRIPAAPSRSAIPSRRRR